MYGATPVIGWHRLGCLIMLKVHAFICKWLKNWIVSVSAGIWSIVEKQKAYAIRTKTESSKIGVGDKIIFYVKGTRQFCGAFRIGSKWHEPNKTWPHCMVDEVDLIEVRVGTASLRSVVGYLRFVKKRGLVGLHLYGGLANYGRAITDYDYDVIISHMQQTGRLTEI